MKTTLLILLAGLTLPLIAKETDLEKWSRIHREMSEENSRRFRERLYHDEIVKQQERIHRESVWQRERIASEQREHLERIESAIPRYPIHTPRFEYRYGQGRITGTTTPTR